MKDKTTQEPVKLSTLIKEQKPKGEAPITKHFYSKMTPDELAAWRARSQAKANATRERKKLEVEAVKEKAKALMPHLLAEQLLAEEAREHNWVPKQETIDQLKSLMGKNISMEEMRRKYFKTVTDDVWHKMMKFAFRSSVQNIEDVGNEVFRGRESALKDLKSSLKEIKSQIKIFCKEKNTKIIPAYLLESKHKLIGRIAELTNDYAMTLHRTGAVGDKGKSPTMHLHLSTPRPQKAKVVAEVNENDLVVEVEEE